MSSPKVDVKALAQLARLEVSAEELAKLEKQIPDILAFVETIQKVSGDAGEAKPMLKNVMRDDASSSGGPHEPGIYTKTLLDAAPAKEGDRIAVKQVISRKK